MGAPFEEVIKSVRKPDAPQRRQLDLFTVCVGRIPGEHPDLGAHSSSFDVGSDRAVSTRVLCVVSLVGCVLSPHTPLHADVRPRTPTAVATPTGS